MDNENEKNEHSSGIATRRSKRSTRASIKACTPLKREESSSPETSEKEEDATYSPRPSKKGSRKSTTAEKKSTSSNKKSAQPSSKKQNQRVSRRYQRQAESGAEDTTADYKLTKEEKRDIDKAFDTYDTNCCNFIHRRDLKSALRALGYEPRSDEIQRLTRQYSGIVKEDMISRESFYEIMQIKIGNSQNANKPKGLPEEISKVFQLFDVDNTGKVTFENLKAIARELGEKISDEEIQEMIDEADLDGDHEVDESEFLKIMKKTSLY